MSDSHEVQRGYSAAGLAAELLARRIAPALTKGAIGWKLALGLAALLLALLGLAALVGAIGAAFQHTAAPWPVRPDVARDGSYRAGGWAVSSRFGWRDDPLTGAPSFHDGIDIVSVSGGCPFGAGCPLPALLDGVVTYVGWDQSGAADPLAAGGGQVVIMENGAGDHEALYAHLELYRVTVQLQGRIDDDHGRYDAYADYAPIGAGELTPDLGGAAIEMWCARDMPGFRAERSGASSVTFAYDRPAQCRTTVRWGERGGGWQGWTADDPPADASGAATLAWETPLTGERGERRAGDVGLRFRAHLTPPPPPPTLTPTAPAETPQSAVVQIEPARAAYGQGGMGLGWNAPAPGAARPRWCRAEGVGTRCAWVLSDIPEAGKLAPRAAEPPLAVVFAGQAHAPVGGRINAAVSVFAGDAAPASVTLRISGPATLAVLEARASSGGCSVRGASATCTVAAGAGAPATIALVIAVLPDATPGGRATLRATAEAGQRRAEDEFVLAIDPYAVTPEPWPPPTDVPAQAPTSVPAQAPVSAPTDIPAPAPTRAPGQAPGPGQPPVACAARALVPLAGVTGPGGASAMMRLQEDAASRFQAARAEILAATGRDALARLADALRAPEFRTDKPGVARRSWHMAGRAIDLDQGGPWRLTPDGRLTRVWIGATDVTAILTRHGWSRIPPSEGVSEWWHYEYRADGVSWAGAMLQVWPSNRLRAAFPEIAWGAAACGGGDEPDAPMLDAEACAPGAPSFASAVEVVPGCGPPVRPGDRVYQLESPLGFVGMTGRTTGPHLHLGLRVRGYRGTYQQTDVCTPEWLGGRAPPDAACWTEMADPLAFLPLAPGQAGSGAGALPEGAPYQLPPPDYPGSLYREPRPGAAPAGQYWSPFADGGRYGGGSALDWIAETTCRAWDGFPWCDADAR